MLSVKRTVVRTSFPYPLKWDRGNLDVRIEDKVFEVHFERQYREDMSQGPPDSGLIAPNQELQYDRLGRVAYTRVEIYFPMYVEHDVMDPELPNWVHAVINRLLSVYRYTTGEFYVDTIPRNELAMQYAVRTIKEDGTFDNRETLVGFDGSIGGWLQIAQTLPISDKARQLLRDGTELSIPRVLYLNARREQLLERYRMAVVEAETAFEAIVDQVVSQYYMAQGRSKADVERLLDTTAFKNLIDHHISRCCGEPFDGTPEHAAWKSDLYDLRNSVVHDGASVEPNQASQALDAAEQAITWIEARTSTP